MEIAILTRQKKIFKSNLYSPNIVNVQPYETILKPLIQIKYNNDIFDLVSTMTWSRDIVTDIIQKDVEAVVSGDFELPSDIEDIITNKVPCSIDLIISERDIAKAAVIILLGVLCQKDIQIGDIQDTFDQISMDYQIENICILKIFECVVSIFKYLSVKFNIQFPDTSHNLPIFKGFARIKIETPQSGPGGIHMNIHHSELKQFLLERLSKKDKDQVIHLILGSKSKFLLDIDIKRDQVSSEVFQQASNLNIYQVQQEFTILANLCEMDFQSRNCHTDPMIFMYKSPDKVSIRVCLRINCLVQDQKRYLEGLQAISKRNTDISGKQTIYDILVQNCDLAVHRKGASIRLPWFPKIKQGFVDKRAQFTQMTKIIPDINSRVQQLYDMFCFEGNQQDQYRDLQTTFSLPIINIDKIQLQNSQQITGQISISDVITAYRQISQQPSAEITNSKASKQKNIYEFININGALNCPICQKQHQNQRNERKHIGFFNKRGFVLRCASKGFRKAGEHECYLLQYEAQEEKKQLKDSSYQVVEGLTSEQIEQQYIKSIPNGQYCQVSTQYISEFLDKREIDLDRDNQYSLRDIIHEHQIVCIRSHMGSGKTQLLSNYIKSELKSNVLWISTRKSYTNAMKQRLEELNFYQYDDNLHQGRIIQEGRVIVQIESLQRVRLQNFKFIVLDEFMAILQQAIQKPHIYQLLENAISMSKQTIMLDAQFELSAFKIIQMLFQKRESEFTTNRPVFIDNVFKPFKDRQHTIFYGDLQSNVNLTLVTKQIVQSVKSGKNVYTFCSTIKQQQDLAQSLEINGIQRTDILILNTQEIATPSQKRKCFANLNQEIFKYKVLITTAVLTIGVDLNNDHFQIGIGVLSKNNISSQQFLQAVHRARQIQKLVLLIPEDQNKASPRLADIQRESISKIEYQIDIPGKFEVFSPNYLSLYTRLYMQSQELFPDSYISFWLQQMGYQYLDHVQIDLSPIEIKRVSRKKQQNQENLADIDIQSQYQIYTSDSAQPVCNQLAELFELAPYVIKDFAPNTQSIKKKETQINQLTTLKHYLNEIGMSIQEFKNITNIYFKGKIHRLIANILTDNKDIKTITQLIEFIQNNGKSDNYEEIISFIQSNSKLESKNLIRDIQASLQTPLQDQQNSFKHSQIKEYIYNTHYKIKKRNTVFICSIENGIPILYHGQVPIQNQILIAAKLKIQQILTFKVYQ